MKTVFAVIVAVAMVVGISAVISATNGNTANDGPYSEEDSEQIAREYLLNSATFRFDGLKDSIELSIVTIPADPDEQEFTFIYTFQTGHSGHGDRSGLVILPVITDHVIEITVAQGRVTSAVCCGTWDEIAGEYLAD